MKKTQHLLFMVAMLYALSPLWAQAAFNDVTTDGGSASIVLDDSSSYDIDAANRVESFTANASTIDFVVLPGSVISITSNDRKNFTYSATTCETVEKTCNSDLSRLFIQCNNQSTSHTVTVTPSGTCTASSGGGSNGGGSSAPTKNPEPEKVIAKPIMVEVPKPAPAEIKLVRYEFKKQFGSSSKGEDVKQLQLRLKEIGFLPATTVVNDKFGSATVLAVKKLQKANGIAQVGNVGTATLKALNKVASVLVPTPAVTAPNSVVAPAPIVNSDKFTFIKQLKSGNNNADVLQLQIKLKALGYLPASVTPNGNFGSATVLAVKKFQKANGIAQVGNVGSATLKALNK